MAEPAVVACIQASSQFIDDENEAESIIKKNVKRHIRLLDMLPEGATPIGHFPQIVVFPEFSLQGMPSKKWSVEVWRKWLNKVAVPLPGEVSDEFGKKSVEHGCYQQVCVWEAALDFPGHAFETVFITDPKGKMVYKRRRSALSPEFGVAQTPELYTEYLKKYPNPMDAFFPVLDTPYGCFGGMLCCEMSTPEISRGLMLNGAEILLHSTSETDGGYMDGMSPRDWERRIRARDNCCYMVSTNIGKIVDCNYPEDRDRGRSEIIDYMGRTLARREFPGEGMILGSIDVTQLRKARRNSWALTSHGEVFSDVGQAMYKDPIWPKDERPYTTEGVAEFRKKLVANLTRRRILRKPEE